LDKLGVKSLHEAVVHVAAQMPDPSARKLYLEMMRNAGLSGKIMELQGWAQRVRIDESGRAVRVERYRGLLELAVTAPTVSPGCSLLMCFVPHLPLLSTHLKAVI
jgi:hypothetical protein